MVFNIFIYDPLPPDDTTITPSSGGLLSVNTSVNNTATNNNVPLFKYIWVFE